MRDSWPIGLIAAALIPLGLIAAASDGSATEMRFADLYRDAIPVLDVRYRFEFVDQGGFDADAKANTIRTRFGFETGKVAGFGLGVDAE